ncbi:gamma-glutamylcyclotransferase family protein [Kitasatospora mediocidica]|uniref:gamma-glutamylcyclotransferase family protein n=1 Tax=Kitasatospora mediocidica TaxID=58352 RepID=UPI00056160A3|nr:gamma-glutamylcyclotransferase family protein [Kitasatospora mediocidica]
MLPFFAYGTLRPGQRNHAQYLGGRCEAVRPAVLDGAALHRGPGYPYAVLAPGQRVHGDLITVRPADYPAVLAALDDLEDCLPDGSGIYVRLSLPVTVQPRAVRPGADARQVDAWVYLAGPAESARLRAAPAPIPSGDWLRRG